MQEFVKDVKSDCKLQSSSGRQDESSYKKFKSVIVSCYEKEMKRM